MVSNVIILDLITANYVIGSEKHIRSHNLEAISFCARPELRVIEVDNPYDVPIDFEFKATIHAWIAKDVKVIPRHHSNYADRTHHWLKTPVRAA